MVPVVTGEGVKQWLIGVAILAVKDLLMLAGDGWERGVVRSPSWSSSMGKERSKEKQVVLKRKSKLTMVIIGG